jgi:beta-galactosidase
MMHSEHKHGWWWSVACPTLVLIGATLLGPPLHEATAAVSAPTVSLSGQWRFQLDREGTGERERWFERSLTQRIHLPGALQNEGFGDDITVDTKWVGDVGIDRWKRGPQYDRYRQPGNIKVPFFLQPQKHYVGVAWYQRDLEIPAAWQDQRVVLTLERPHWETRVWVDAKSVGSNDSLSTAHVYDLGTGLHPGKHTLTIRVDNQLVVDVGPMAHSVTDHSQGDWNGIVGNIELSATSPVWIEDLQVYPDLATRSVRVKGTVGNATGQAGSGTVKLLAQGLQSEGDHSARKGTNATIPVSWDGKGGAFERTLALGSDAPLWDEFQPARLRLTATLGATQAPAGSGGSSKTVVFGLREISTRNREFILNGHPLFFRGTLECCIFPRTGYPPTDVESWRRIVGICKSYGLNHMRFHSWCPPEAAFTAADELGFYYQVECGVFTKVGDGKPLDEWIYRESQRIVAAYGNHPSFVLFTHGNEPHGAKREQYLAKWVEFWKSRDPRHLVTGGTAFPQLPEDQFQVFHGPRSAADWFGRDYGPEFAAATVPVIVHEMGQWCVYPNFDEIKKYTGPLKAKNFEIFRDSLAEHGMLDQWRDFLRASGRLQVMCYKEEIEAALDKAGIGGLQLLDLHDFPGQGTALVGVVDAFWDAKSYVTPEEYRRFCGPTVPLARLPKRAWTTDETLQAEVEVTHLGPRPLENALVNWKLVDDRDQSVASGEFPPQLLPLGKGIPGGKINLNLSRLPAPKAYKLVVSVTPAPSATGVAGAPKAPGDRLDTPLNDWNLWVYPAKQETTPPPDVLVTQEFDAAALSRLAAGGKVLLLPSRFSWEHPQLFFEPVFWNRYMFNIRPPQTLGLLIAARHPALAQFPTEFYQDWQWQDIVTHAHGLVLDGLPQKLRPIVQPIDDWNTNRRLGLLFECRVGRGRLLVCSADLTTDLEHRPAAHQLRQSLLAYTGGRASNPPVEVPAAQLTRLFAPTETTRLIELGAKVLETDSEDCDHGHPAASAFDGDGDTYWQTKGRDPKPHHLAIDLGREVTLRGIMCLQRKDGAEGRIGEVEVFCSNDARAWGRPVVTAKWRSTDQPQMLHFPQPVKAHYLKLVVSPATNSSPAVAIAELDVVTEGR